MIDLTAIPFALHEITIVAIQRISYNGHRITVWRPAKPGELYNPSRVVSEKLNHPDAVRFQRELRFAVNAARRLHGLDPI